jgi:hypothetical protein
MADGSIVDVVAQFKTSFFDKRAIIDALGKDQVAALSRAGAFARRAAKSLVRYRRAASKPGSPPSAHRGKAGRSALRELIFFAWDPATKSVVTGPAAFGSRDAPGILERGGAARIKNARRKLRQLGHGGEIRIGSNPSKTTKTATQTLSGQVDVTYCVLRTEAQVTRANQINEQLYGPEGLKAISVAARPFMRPALESTAAKLPDLWGASVT